MNKYSTERISSFECSFATMDVLGFKDKLNAEDRCDSFEYFLDAVEDVFSAFGRVDEKTLLYSDSLIFYKPTTNTSTTEALKSAAAFVTRVTAACLKKKLLVRGAISFGKLLTSSELEAIAGPVVNECRDHYETTEWIGCHLTPSAAKIVQELTEFERGCFFEPLRVPFKRSGNAILPIMTWAINWRRILCKTIIPSSPLPDDPLKELMNNRKEGVPPEHVVTEYFKGLLEQYKLDPANEAARQKVENTLKVLF